MSLPYFLLFCCLFVGWLVDCIVWLCLVISFCSLEHDHLG